MGKVRTRVLGMEDEEKKQKEEQKKRALEKKQKMKVKEPSEDEEKVEAEAPAEEKKKEKKSKAKSTEVKVKTRGKKYTNAKKSLDKNKVYAVTEAVSLLKKIKYAKFDESVELHINVEKAGLKGEVELPHSTGKTVKTAIVNDDLLAQIEKGNIDFDILITHPSYMPKLARFAKILGPKGLMPNPKAGTISDNPEAVAKKFEKGSLRWKTEAKFPLIHQMIGKMSFDENALAENVKAFLQSVGKSQIGAAYVKTTMSPAIKLDLEKI